MAIMIKKGLKEIMDVHSVIIKTMISNKSRSNSIVEKYEGIVLEHIKIPSNRFISWTRDAEIYIESVKTSQIMEYDLIEQYNKYIKDILTYERQYLISIGEIRNLEYNFDKIVDKIFGMEKKIIDLKKIIQEQNKEISNSMDSHMDKSMDKSMDNSMDKSMDNSMDNLEEESENEIIEETTEEENIFIEKKICGCGDSTENEDGICETCRCMINKEEEKKEEEKTDKEKVDEMPGETKSTKQEFKRLLNNFSDKYDDKEEENEDDILKKGDEL